MRRKGGAGRRGKARTVHASNVEEELICNIGAPQYTWGDGSCWLWAVAGALHKLEGNENPTENDIRLEREWRAAIQEIVKTHGMPMTDDEFRGLGEGVQYTRGRLTRGGTWGGGTEHQALAMHLKINTIIWDRRYIGRVGAQQRQLYVCTPQGNAFLKNVSQTREWIRQSESASIHILYDDVAKHYEYFGEATTSEDTVEEPEPKTREIENGKRKEDTERGEKEIRETETSRDVHGAGGTTTNASQEKMTAIKEGSMIQRSEVQIGTLNISGIAFSYRGKYMKTEEEILKIKPGWRI
eukprot:2990784-Pleurochrysis_carterae.AAC.1